MHCLKLECKLVSEQQKKSLIISTVERFRNGLPDCGIVATCFLTPLIRMIKWWQEVLHLHPECLPAVPSWLMWFILEKSAREQHQPQTTVIGKKDSVINSNTVKRKLFALPGFRTSFKTVLCKTMKQRSFLLLEIPVLFP